MTAWPKLKKEHIDNYLINSPACDGLPNGAYLSLEAIDFFVSGWVDRIKVYIIDSSAVYLSGRVARSQSTTLEEHRPWVCCLNEGSVQAASCTCMAGLGRVCSHVSALLFKILEANALGLNQKKSCTEIPMQWNGSTRRHVNPEKIRKLTKNKDHRQQLIHLSPTKKFEQYFSAKDMHKELNSSPLLKLLQTEGTIWSSILNQEIEVCNQNIPVEAHTCSINDMNFEEPVQLNDIPCKKCSDFYKRYLFISSQQISFLRTETTQQSQSDLWEDSRRIRLTASTAPKVPKKLETDPITYLKSHTYKTFKGNAHTKYGIVNEAQAIKDFTKITGLQVSKCGTVVCETETWISASPDGLVGDYSIIEVKCPTRNLECLIASGKYDVRADNNGHLYLHKTGPHGYFLQCQITLFCTKRKTCYFVLWRETLPFIILVHYEEEYMKKELSRLRKFYFEKMLPYLQSQVEQGHLVFGKKYMDLILNQV